MTLETYANTAVGLARFAAQRAAIGTRPDGGTERLAAFFAAAGPMVAYPKRRDRSVPSDPARFAKAMGAISGALDVARDVGVFADPWTLARLKRREVANAAVLAGLWSPAAGGKLATKFLAAFFDRLRGRSDAAALPDLNSLEGGYLVRTEDCPMGDAADRVDITIEGRDFLVGVEVKIDAALQPGQLGRYQATIERRAADQGKRAAVIFLSPRRSVQQGVVQAGWSDVAGAARAVAPEKAWAFAVNYYLIGRFGAHVARF